MGAAEKVIKFENENTKIYEIIEGWFRELNRNNRDYEDVYEGGTSKTQTSYETDVRLFMRIVRGKSKGSELEYLTYDELQFTQEDLEEFKEKILDMRNEDGKYTYTNKSFNRKLSAIKNFIRYMGKKKVIKDISFINYISNEKEKDNHYDVMSVNEVLEMSDWIITTERYNKEKKYYLVLFSLDTCIRKSAVLRLKWSDFTEQDNCIVIKGIDKGNDEFTEKISKEFYKELLSIKDEQSDKVFEGLTKEAIDKLMQRYREAFNVPKERKLVWHSIRKGGVSFRYRATNDIREAQRAARHKNITTTQIYLDTEDYGALGAVSSAGKIDNKAYKKVEHETLIKAIELLNKDTQLLLNMKINEILNINN
jgi:integrase